MVENTPASGKKQIVERSLAPLQTGVVVQVERCPETVAAGLMQHFKVDIVYQHRQLLPVSNYSRGQLL